MVAMTCLVQVHVLMLGTVQCRRRYYCGHRVREVIQFFGGDSSNKANAATEQGQQTTLVIRWPV